MKIDFVEVTLLETMFRTIQRASTNLKYDENEKNKVVMECALIQIDNLKFDYDAIGEFTTNEQKSFVEQNYLALREYIIREYEMTKRP